VAWRALPGRYAAVAGPEPALDVSEDNLLFSALSPVANPGVPLDDRLARVLPVARALDRPLVFLTVDEGCPGGLDLTAGIACARAFAAAGARGLVVGQGTARLPALLARRRASSDPTARFRETADWIRPHVDVPVYARAYGVSPSEGLALSPSGTSAGP
jgi:hypothetical protein